MLPASATPHDGLAHRPTLDGLRALAVLLVLYHHAPGLFGRGQGAEGGIFHASRGAWLGVDLFFVLSGYLITNILLHGRGQEHPLRRFWIRRALRIFPLAYAYLAVLALLAWGTSSFPALRDPASFGMAAAYLVNLHVADGGWCAPPLALLWSLAVEEQFYLVWPLCALRLSRRAITALLVVAVLAAPAARVATLARVGDVAAYALPWCRMDALAWGALLALAWDTPWRAAVRRAAQWLALPALGVVGWVLWARILPVTGGASPAFVGLGMTAVALAFATLVALALAPPPALAAALSLRPLRAIGRVSYGLYVWHVIVGQVVAITLHTIAPSLPFVGYLAVWLLALGLVAAASWRWLESPLLRLKERWAA